MTTMTVHFQPCSPKTPWYWRWLRPRFAHCAIEYRGLVLNITRKNGIELYRSDIYRARNRTTPVVVRVPGSPSAGGYLPAYSLFDWYRANLDEQYDTLGTALAWFGLASADRPRNCVTLVRQVLREAGKALPQCRTPDDLHKALT